MTEIKTGITKNGIVENCEWVGVGPCPRHHTHQLKSKANTPQFNSDILGSFTIIEEPNIVTVESYHENVSNEENNTLNLIKNAVLSGEITQKEAENITTTPPALKQAEPLLSQSSHSGQLYNIIEQIEFETEESFNIDSMKEKYDGIKTIDNIDDAENAFLNEKANNIYNAAWLIESDSQKTSKYDEETIEAAESVARYQNNPTGVLPVEKTDDTYHLSGKYEKLLTLLQEGKEKIKQQAAIKDEYRYEKPSDNLTKTRLEKTIHDKKILQLEKSARNPFNKSAKKELTVEKDKTQNLENKLTFFETTND